MESSRLILQPRHIEEDVLQVGATLVRSDGQRQVLWWRVPAEWQDAVTSWADPFLVAFICPIMQAGGEVIVEGRASPSLLENLETFMAIWHSWFPQIYRPVQLRAEEEVEPVAPTRPAESITGFSCGMDSCYSVWRHHHGLMGRRNRRITAGIVMNGFDVWLNQDPTIYPGLLADAREVLSSVGLACIPVITNFHEVKTTWAHSFGTQLISALYLFSARFGSAVIANNMPYRQPITRWGSNPFSDAYLASRRFALYDDGGESTRAEKAQLVSQWPQAMGRLRVCFGGPSSHTHTNCCLCEKCIRTILAFRMVGVPRPAAFAADVTDKQIRAARFHSAVNIDLWTELIDAAQQRGLAKTPWARAMRTAARRYHFKRLWRAAHRPFIPIRNSIRTIVRGSPLSRRELADHKERGLP